jgi:hypothetical protein
MTSSIRSGVLGLRAAGCAVLALAVLAASGCGKPKGELTGKIKYKGKELAWGDIQVQAADGTAIPGTIKDGVYTVSNIPPGVAKIRVNQIDYDAQAKQAKDLSDQARGGLNKDSTTIPKTKSTGEVKNQLPTRYGAFETSGLTHDVKAGKNEKDIDLE